MKKIIIAVLGIIFLYVPNIVFAANDMATMPTSSADPYIGISLGTGGMDTPELTSDMKAGGNYSENLRGFAGRGYLGCLWGGNFQYGGEVGASLYPENKYSVSQYNWKYSGYNLDLLAVLKYNISGFNIFGKAGVALVFQDLKRDVNYYYSNSDDTSRMVGAPEIAVGLGYDFSHGIGLGLTYSHIFGGKLNYDNPTSFADISRVVSVNMLTLNFTYHFLK